MPVESIALVGHSMGGLVVRSACATAVGAGEQWLESVTDIVTIGAPHGGSPMELAAVLAARGLGMTPQTRPLAEFLDGRSQGIKDLRLGDVGFGTETERVLGARYGINRHFVAGVVTSDLAHPVGAIVGDLMVRPASGTGALELEPTNVVVVGRVHHFNLMHTPAVVDQVMEWLGSDG